ncbi:MAG TPA: hypothetical protein VM938_13610 [Acidimicrobiales bacterium]|nr:hypothetical protein [Acidimicrobiales bacterium]
MKGNRDAVEWRLYLSRERGTCLAFHVRDGNLRQSGGSGTCEQKPPLDVSLFRNVSGRFAYGVVTAEAVEIHLEHTDGAKDVLRAESTPDFEGRFYAGEVRPTPFKRVVALGARGEVVANYRDVSRLNTTG